MIANAIVDIWQAEGIQLILKYEDDLKKILIPGCVWSLSPKQFSI